MNLTTQADALAARVQQIADFAAKYGPQINQPELEGHLSVDTNCARYGFHVHHVGEENRDKVLAFYGDLFGREGWKAKPDVFDRQFDWSKEIAGVQVTLYGAEALPKMTEYSIPATKFPLQLTDEEVADARPTYDESAFEMDVNSL